MGRIGVLGGSFDPPHWGHLQLANEAYKQLNLDTVLWMPTGHPPHKSEPTPAYHRIAMIEIAIAYQPNFLISRRDIDRPGPHYTADLLDLMRNDYGDNTSFWFLIGQDSLRDLSDWHEPESILKYCRLGVYPRQGYELNWEVLEIAVPGLQDKIDWLDGEPIGFSSHMIRRLLKEGHSVTEMVPPGIIEYIREHGLYQK